MADTPAAPTTPRQSTLSRLLTAGRINRYEYDLIEAEARSTPAEALDPLANRYESALNRIANLGLDAPAFGPDPADFYRNQLMTAIGTAARALPSPESDPT